MVNPRGIYITTRPSAACGFLKKHNVCSYSVSPYLGMRMGIFRYRFIIIVSMSDAEKFARFYDSAFGKQILDKESEYVRRELKDCGSILDIGCGIGTFEQRLSDLNITGLDISEERIEEAAKVCDNAFVLGDAENLGFEDSSFDAVFFIATIEFVNDYKKAVREALRVTRPGGKLLVIMLNPESRYFREQTEDKDSYFRKILQPDPMEIRDYISAFYYITREEYFLGISGRDVFDSSDKEYASLYAVTGEKQRLE
jgi:ubiquinone/menaquinone biosynthesis C-methylase UbiE